ncbi:MAG: hypothetical protein AMXMBFR84_08920 [Candidatus Hydrogenedentota bacterium]
MNNPRRINRQARLRSARCGSATSGEFISPTARTGKDRPRVGADTAAKARHGTTSRARTRCRRKARVERVKAFMWARAGRANVVARGLKTVRKGRSARLPAANLTDLAAIVLRIPRSSSMRWMPTRTELLPEKSSSLSTKPIVLPECMRKGPAKGRVRDAVWVKVRVKGADRAEDKAPDLVRVRVAGPVMDRPRMARCLQLRLRETSHPPR